MWVYEVITLQMTSFYFEQHPYNARQKGHFTSLLEHVELNKAGCMKEYFSQRNLEPAQVIF